MAAIEIHPFRLAKRPLTPIKADPIHAIDDGLNRFIRRATLIGILNAENKHTLLSASEEPIEQSCAHSSYVEKSRRTWGKPDANLVHDGVVPSSCTTDPTSIPCCENSCTSPCHFHLLTASAMTVPRVDHGGNHATCHGTCGHRSHAPRPPTGRQTQDQQDFFSSGAVGLSQTAGGTKAAAQPRIFHGRSFVAVWGAHAGI